MSKPKNQWFNDVFLPSIFEYVQKSVGLCKNCKISDKQFNICRQNMNEVKCFDSDYRVSYTYYNYMWNDRQVTVSRHNDAYINFSMSTVEAEKMRNEEEAKREVERLEKLDRIKQNPERLEKSLAKKLAKLEKLQNELSEAIDDEEEAGIIDSIKDDISKLQKDIDFLMH